MKERKRRENRLLYCSIQGVYYIVIKGSYLYDTIRGQENLHNNGHSLHIIHNTPPWMSMKDILSLKKTLVKEKEYIIICVWTASLKTLPGKPSGTKPRWREKECRTYLYLPLIKTIIIHEMKNQIIFCTSCSKVLLKVDSVEKSVISSLLYSSLN